ncbi:AcrR family transcriptional regulator [Anaerosolibacter carboniphilus]|uniref:AcrR family transcriptional regulator n=1 Tax=Anaerosolibacter carboniphilus TaxID=1417629 RepID=A0A841KVH7_9FIRM|nr:TetR/AcrR family transcriptional regulator [Anaerosolibacter carboniphilus]MBB6217377.1 AcrR family transcriptional regulator [Anaerosolibacter carboniphilus]
MQVQKEEVREALINKAADEFFQHGFEKASIRRIAKAAGTTIGNFYNYFQNKEELFYTITTPVYENFIDLFSDHHQEQVEHGIHLEISKDLRNKIHEAMKGFDKAFSKGLVILIDGSKGTKYEHVREEILVFITVHFENHLKVVSESAQRQFHPYFSRAIASGFLDGLLDILKKEYSKSEMESLVADYVLFYILGVADLG